MRPTGKYARRLLLGTFLEKNVSDVVTEGIQIAHDSSSLHPDAWVSDDFNYPDTATWLAAMRAKAHYQLAAESHITQAAIDSTVQFGGHNTLKATVTSGNPPLWAFDSGAGTQKQWMRFGIKFPVGFAALMFGINVWDDASGNQVEAALDYDGSSEAWKSGQSFSDLYTQSLASIRGTSPILVVSVERIDNSTVETVVWQDGIKKATVQEPTFGGTFASLDYILLQWIGNSISDFVNVLFYEVIDAATNPAPYSGLEL